MRALSSGETVGGKMGTDGASISTVFRTASTTSAIPSSFSIDVYIAISHTYGQIEEYNAPARP
jgi:hypothetical protein